MAKTKKETFLLSRYFDRELTLLDVEQFEKEYDSLIEKIKLPIPAIDTLELMLWAKRHEVSFGPYQNLSFFEISNRIYSDLVLLRAAKILFNEYHIRSIQLNMSNKGGNDMVITNKKGNTVIGEAFNTACSFFQIKLRSDLKKFKVDEAGYIAFNKTALNEQNQIFLENKKEQYPKIEFIDCDI